jgi:hypothetical protein
LTRRGERRRAIRSQSAMPAGLQNEPNPAGALDRAGPQNEADWPATPDSTIRSQYRWGAFFTPGRQGKVQNEPIWPVGEGRDNRTIAEQFKANFPGAPGGIQVEATWSARSDNSNPIPAGSFGEEPAGMAGPEPMGGSSQTTYLFSCQGSMGRRGFTAPTLRNAQELSRSGGDWSPGYRNSRRKCRVRPERPYRVDAVETKVRESA